MSTPTNAANKGDYAKTVLMPGDPIRAKFIAENFLENPRLVNEVRGMYGFTGTYKGVPVSVQGSGMGMPSMGIYSWELFHDYDVENIIRIGTAGSFADNISLGSVILSLAASTDSNYQGTFGLNGTYAPSASWDLILKAIRVSEELGIPVTAGNTLCSDHFYEADPNWWRKWKEMNVIGVEMEAAALYMNAAYFGRNALAMMTVSDNFNTGGRSSLEERQKSLTDMIKIALEIAIK